MSMRQHLRVRHEQSGMASFVVVMLLMVMTTIIVLGFSSIVRRNQQQTLDRNLSARAFYAAESGVNVAVQKLQADPAIEKKECGTDGNFTDDDYTIADDTVVTCLTIDNTPTSYVYALTKSDARVIPIRALSGTYETIDIYWKSPGGTANYDASCITVGDLPPDTPGSWRCNAPMLRLDLVPVTVNLGTDKLMGSQYTAFIYPGGSGSAETATYVGGSQNNLQQTRCVRSGVRAGCHIAIRVPAGSADFRARIMSLYGNADVEICANACSVRLTGGQVVIDATGRALDVVRRVQVRQSIDDGQRGSTSFTMQPDFAIQAADGLCKRYALSDKITSSFEGSGISILDRTHPCAL